MRKILYPKRFIIINLFILLWAQFLGTENLQAQNVAITDNENYTAENSAMLDVMSTNKGMLVPRLTTAQRKGIISPAAGLMVYDTEVKSFIYYNGLAWITIPQLASSAGTGEALFAVVNHLGDTVFAVYHDGVQIFVDPEAKGKVGGFAVSGRTPTKTGGKVEYLRVTPDSTRIWVNDLLGSKGKVGGFAVSGRTPTKENGVKDYFTINRDSTRIYIDSTASKGKVGGFAVSGRTPTKEGYSPEDYFNISAGTAAEVIDSASRIIWYPKKSALLAGEIHVGSADSVGTNSTALGYKSIAMGNQSQAFGYMTKALGNYSTAIGKGAIANNENSFAFGQWANARNAESYAFGRGAIAEGFRSFAFGSAGVDSAGAITGVTYAKGDYSFAIGQGSQSIGKGSFALGLADTASGSYSVAIGYKNKSTYDYSTTIGYQSKALYNWATSIGKWAVASGDASMAIGYSNKATGKLSTALGITSTASGENAIALGVHCNAGYKNSLAMGFYSESLNDYGIAIGYYAKAGRSAYAFGYEAQAFGQYSSAFGHKIYVYGNYSIGFGLDGTFYSITDQNVMAIMGGKVGIGTVTPNVMLNVDGGTDANLNWGTGYFLIGNVTSANIVMDNNEIQSRNSGNASPLYINHEGGAVWINQVVQVGDKSIYTKSDPMKYGLKQILKIEPIMGYNSKAQNTTSKPTILAENLETIIPEAVLISEENEKGIDYNVVTTVMLNAIKEQQTQIEELKSELEAIKAELRKQ